MHTYVYFIQSCDQIGLIKIGISKNPEDRITQLATGNGSRLKLKGQLKCPSPVSGRDIELKLHKVFKYSSTRGEWFSHSAPLRQLIQEINSGLSWEYVVPRAYELTKDKRIRYNTKRNAQAKRFNKQADTPLQIKEM